MPDLTLDDFRRLHPGKALDEALSEEARVFWGEQDPPLTINPSLAAERAHPDLSDKTQARQSTGSVDGEDS